MFGHFFKPAIIFVVKFVFWISQVSFYASMHFSCFYLLAVMLCYVASAHAWTGLVCDGRIKSLLDNGGVLVTRVSLRLLTNVSVLGELNIGQFDLWVF